jgi:hypothetical protein
LVNSLKRYHIVPASLHFTAIEQHEEWYQTATFFLFQKCSPKITCGLTFVLQCWGKKM